MYQQAYHASPRSSGGQRRNRSGGSRSGGYNRARSSSRRGKVVKQTIHPSKFIRAAKPVEIREYTPTNTFNDFTLHDLLKQNVVKKGFTAPSEIQDKAIPVALEGRDVVGIADTGTGKTTAFTLPALHKIMTEPGHKMLVIAPTRELAQQIEDELRSFAKGSGLFGALLIGGSAMGPQLRDLRATPAVVIGTPGRIKDHVERGTLDLGTFDIVVLDEVDRMVDMGFIADIRFLLDAVHPVRQSLFFSATLDPKIEQLIHSFLTDPVTISVKTSETSANVAQDVITYRDSVEKISKLHDLLNQEEVAKVLVFDETQRDVERLGKELASRGFRVDALHGGKTQGQRSRALKRFRNNEISVLVATDVAARGIDISDITHVVNYSVPNAYEDYVHRIGRAGRAGRPGAAYTFLSLFEARF
ncbi:MAG TPA: DEAD/DEAH box helicase [Candidatus Saccharimonadales bacterium]|nr:DEAD/DEAH box helicase [Candidatus Saccharimonadales bacterium]